MAVAVFYPNAKSLSVKFSLEGLGQAHFTCYLMPPGPPPAVLPVPVVDARIPPPQEKTVRLAALPASHDGETLMLSVSYAGDPGAKLRLRFDILEDDAKRIGGLGYPDPGYVDVVVTGAEQNDYVDDEFLLRKAG
jgi:hypothetical protein